MIRTILFAIFFANLVFVSEASAAGNFSPDGRASMITSGYQESRGLSSKKLDAYNWNLTVFGTNVTSGSRLSNYTMLRAAKFSHKKGYAYFKFLPTKKSVMCYNRLVMTNPAAPYIVGRLSVSAEPKDGFLNVQKYISVHSPDLAQDALEKEKRAVFADWAALCNSKRN